ncbi:MAG TPA: ferritin-like domain-containing protein [Anaerolineales bacterium]|nr:ferritin-like domain-containing protein [Anaerolineales bacterium]
MSIKLDSLEKLLIAELKDLYSAEQQLIEALPKVAKAAEDRELRKALQDHLDVTRRQAKRIEQIFERWDEVPTGKKCKGMEGLVKEGDDLVKEKEEKEADADVIDAALIGAAQRVEHYEISAYGTARAFAERLGYADIASMLQESLEEERMADELLSKLAVNNINRQAIADNGKVRR